MIIELEVGGARVIVSGDNLTINVSSVDAENLSLLRKRSTHEMVPGPSEIKLFRKSKGLRQHQFCELFEVNQSTVSRWETGEEAPSGPAAILLRQMIDGHVQV